MTYPSGFVWKLEAIDSGDQRTLYAPDGKVAAHVWWRGNRATWHVFDEHGVGGENDVCEYLSDAKLAVESAVLRAGRHEIVREARRAPSPAVKALVEALRGAMFIKSFSSPYALFKDYPEVVEALAAVEREIGGA